ncbi:MAG: efflux transporter outer membrane subunit [Bacteroidales bacterium]|jgi:multidrug efflux system outer membrane protein|nr:efflux transporter outer membrane subunit [Bacteroidales bacterium]
MTRIRIFVTGSCTLALALLLNGCLVGPKYVKQSSELPESFGETELKTDAISNTSWWATFTDPILDTLIDKALTNNYDVMMAMSRIEQAALASGVAKADFWPQISYQAGISRGDFTGGSQMPVISNNAFGVGLLNWELDLWGKYRHAQHAANANFAASRFAYQATMLAIESETARLYFQLLDYRERLRISQNTLKSRDASVSIISQRLEKGVVPEIDLNQAVIQQAEAAVAVPLYEQLSQNIIHALHLLMGESFVSDSLFAGNLTSQKLPPSIPDVIPSELLKRRPDIMLAEQQLIAQYAMAGIAQSLRFPSLSLTMAGGVASNDLNNLFSGNPAWSVGAGLFGPLLHFGKNKKNAEIALKRIEELQANYQQVVLAAFLEVKDALAEIESFEQQIAIRKTQLDAARNAAMLSRDRYNGGVTSYLELLDSDRILFSTELTLSQSKQGLLSAYVKLFKALGGGWE